MAQHIISINTLADLKATGGDIENIVITLGKNTKGDNLGALYYWDANSTETEDVNFNNIVSVTNIVTGRWKKVFTRMMQLPHGILVINAGKKEFYYTGVVNSSGECLVNLTIDNTTNGTSIFSEVWFDDSKAEVNASTANDAVTSYRKSLSANLKQLTHGFVRGSSSVVSILGATVIGLRAALVNTPVRFKVEGI